MNHVDVWNHNCVLSKMHRLTYDQAKKLQVGEHVYYINTNDLVSGVVYDAKVIGKNSKMLTLECTPVKESVDVALTNRPHVECFAFIDALYRNTHQALFDNLVFREELY